MKQKILALVLILLLFSVVGCIQKAETTPAETTPEVTSVPITDDVDSVDAMSDDLDTSGLNNLDKDLAEVTW